MDTVETGMIAFLWFFMGLFVVVAIVAAGGIVYELYRIFEDLWTRSKTRRTQT